MVNLPKFVIHLERFNSDIAKVALLLEKYEEDRKRAGMQVSGKSLPLQAQYLRAFPVELFKTIEREAAEQGEDTFGSRFRGIQSYQYIEVAVEPTYQIMSVRLLGDTSNPITKQTRYTIFAIQNNIDPTTINIVSDIRNISDQTRELFGVPGLSDALRCGQDSNVLEGVVNRAGSVVGLAELSIPANGISSDITWTDFVNTYFFPTAKIVPNQTPLSPDDVKSLSERFDRNSAKTREDLERENEQLASARFKLNLVQTREGGFELNNAGSAVLANTDKLKSEIQGAVGDPVALLNSCYAEIFDKFSLGCLIKSAAECIIPPLTCKEILRGLRVDTLQERIGLAFPNQPRVVELVNEQIQILRDENPDEEIATDQFLDAIEIFIDLEALCDVVNYASSGFGIPTISLPDLPIIDLFASVTVEIENAILEALIQAIKTMIIGILEDLASCDTLDAFVAGALQGQFGPDAGIAGDLANLFLEPDAVTDPERGAIASSLGRRWNDFANQTDEILKDSVRLKADGGAAVLSGALGVRTEIDAIGGVSGLARGLADGTIGELTGSVLIGNMIEGQVDVTELLQFSGDGSEALNSLVAEIGRFELSDDGESFTLRRISDDQVVTILETSSIVGPPILIDVNVPLSNLVGRSLDDTVSVLSPGETLELLAGEPSERTITIVREIVRIRYPELASIGDPVSLFVKLGELTGLNQLRDSVILLAQNDSQRDIARKFCPEDDDRIRLREDILVRGGLDPGEVQVEIDRIVETRRIRFNELIDILAKDGDFTPEEILDNIRCGTGFQPDGKRPQVIEDQLDATLNIMFEPAKMTFDREVPKLVDAISSFRKKKKTIERVVNTEDGGPAFGGNPGESLFQTIAGFAESLGQNSFSINQEGRINPEFQKLLNEGFIPLDQDGNVDGNPEAPAGPYTDGEEPIEINDVVREVGGLFKRGIKISHNDVSLEESANSLSISLKGSLKASSPVSDYAGIKTPKPRWILKYSEEDGEYDLRITSRGEIPSSLYGRVPFFENYRFSRPFQEDTPADIQQELDKFNQIADRTLTRKGVFSYLMWDKLRNALNLPEEQQEDLITNLYSAQYDDFVKDFLFDAGSSFAKNRLLRKLPNKSLKNLGTSVNIAAQDDTTQMLVLNLINFSPTATPEQRKCKADPHLLDLEFIKTLVKEQFDRECENPNDPNDGITPTRKPINAAGFVGVVLTIIRLYVVEYTFRSLFVFDEFGYSETLAEEPLLIDYIAFRMREDITRLGFWDRFETEMIVAYDKMVATNQIDVDDVPASDDGSVGLADTQGSDPNSPYDSESRAVGSNGLPEQLKILTREMMKSVFAKISVLVGKSEDAGINFERSFLNSLDILETYSNFSENDSLSSESSNNQRFLGSNTERGKFVLERYLRVDRAGSSGLGPVVRNQQGNGPYLRDVVSLNNWNDLLKNLPPTTPIDGVFENPWRFGLRLVYISPRWGDSITDPPSSTNYRKMKFGDDYVSLNRNDVEKEKAFYFDELAIPKAVLEGLQQGAAIDLDEPYHQFNSVIIACEEMEIDQFETLGDAEGAIEFLFEEEFQETLLQRLSRNVDYRTLFKHSLFADRLTTLMAIYSTFVVNGEEMKFLLEGTKLELRRLFETMENLGDYTFRPDLGAAENAAKYQEKFNRIGHPAGPSGPDALYLASITPILIFKGLTELIDPNIALTSKIVAAAAAGYLSPKFERAGPGPVRIEGRDINDRFGSVNLLEEVIATDSIFKQEDDGEVVVINSPSVLIDGIETSTEFISPTLREGVVPGLPLIKWTQVYEVERDSNDNPIIGTDGVPEIKRNDDGTLVIRAGANQKGIPVPGGDTNAIQEGVGQVLNTLDNLVNQITLGNIDPSIDIVDSAPVYPGESLNLPYGLVSPALLPINVFAFLGVPYMFCGPPYGPLGTTFLSLEPLIYRTPYFQSAFPKSDISRELKRDYGIDLSGVDKFVCEDDKEEDEE